MSDQLVTLDVADHIATIRLNRPEALNAISGAMAEAVRDAFEKVSDDDDVWVVALLAAGEKAFCVGADLKERAGFDLDAFYANREQIRSMFRAIRKTPQPVVCGVFGFALGGGFELALSCDIVVAAQGTQLGLPEARVGLLPAGGGTQLLTRKLGTSRAKELIFRGRRFDASEAQQLGLVADVVPPGKVDEHTIEVARDICLSSPVAVRQAKRAIDAALGVPIDEGIDIEHEAWRVVIETEDRAEGIKAFNEKRPPEWKNR
ncbi:MAG TPA: enoyl-CoA hydratase-related protein [Actinomycetota bacterium]|nr:enoyl-CoA hydratase-related protein [Actinomycetota bacterium]